MRVLWILFILVSCGDDQKKYYRLENLRVLGIQADSPQLNTSANVTLTPFISYTNGGDTTLDISYKLCLDPGIAFGAAVSCDGNEIDQGVSTFNTSTIGSANYYTGEIDPITVNVPASALAFLATLPVKNQFNGYDLLFIITLTDQADSSQRVETFKRISLTTKTSELNTNPTISGAIQSNGVDISGFPTGKTKLGISGVSAAQNYQSQGNNGVSSFNENQFVSWFANSGEFQFSRVDTDETVEYDTSATSGVIVGVVRDGRGGVAFIRSVF